MGNATKLGTDLWKAMPDSAEKYQAYLCSRDWAERRNAVYKRCGCICERCHINSADHVHHLTYARKYAELPEDLQALCRQCHGKSDYDPAKQNTVDGFCRIGDLFLGRIGNDEYEWNIRCPICRQEQSHIREVATIVGPNSDEQPEPYKGTGFLFAGNYRERRGALIIVFDGECGHAWTLIVTQHKGTDFLTCQLDDGGSR